MKDNAKLNFKSNERSDFADFNCHWWCGNFVSAHSHEDYYEISIVTDGTLFNKINGTNLKQEVKDVILIKPEVSHSIIAEGMLFVKKFVAYLPDFPQKAAHLPG
jgi:quercetin dioxygenase-like cupin family protein